MQPLWKTDIDIKTKDMHSYDPVIPLSDILPARPPSKCMHMYKKTWTRMFVAALFVIGPNGNNSVV